MKLIKSFSRRVGKSLTILQRNILVNDLPKYELQDSDLKSKTICLEIGIGMGEHFINQVQTYPDKLFIGCEPYVNGIVTVLRHFQTSEYKNYRLHADDADLLIEKLPNNLLDQIIVLFPDPWPKARHHKRRILNNLRLAKFYELLKPGGMLNFGSDIHDYVTYVDRLIEEMNQFTIDKSQIDIPHPAYVQTKYHQKALNEGRQPKFRTYRKIT